MAYANMFFGDHQSTENPHQFLESIEASFVAFPGISEAEKCLQFYNLCRSGSDAEEWYKTLQECNSDTTTWAQLVAEFRYRWQHSFPCDALGNLIYSTKPTHLENTARTSITISATTTIPAPTNPAATTIYETMTTTPQQLDRVADSTNRPPPQLQTKNMANKEQDEEESGVEREEGQERRTERGGGATEQEVEELRDMGECERVEETQNEVRDCTPSPTARTESDTMTLHKLARFDGAVKVDKAPGLNPVTHNAPQPEPIKPAHDDVTVDPDCTARMSAAPVDSIPIDSIPAISIPINPIPISHAPADPAPTNLVHSNVTVGPVRTAPVDPNPNPVNPDPGDAATNTTRPAFSSAVPTVPVPINPISIHPAFTVPVDPDPVNPSPATIDNGTPAAHTHVTITYPMPMDSVLADPNPVVCVGPIYITPTEPVHVDPVHAYLLCKFRTCIEDTHTRLLSSIFQFYSSSWRVGEF
ncbi:hypothetical protein PILCRDRAFT_84575 [Piloderma croceum F 1598]|uniref:Retrotransposon gag domain-containing protein n=1 Tax=Piloderma croceum (strain F 1598) TaxID=765440 RepID=A0A0C3GFZ3_PILCF|nr:hypothetical protein PILCRDRAFT_84575 [Piloderma croceum F 1598]